jgi:uncharacterized cupredoxin-like copper-binding protein
MNQALAGPVATQRNLRQHFAHKNIIMDASLPNLAHTDSSDNSFCQKIDNKNRRKIDGSGTAKLLVSVEKPGELALSCNVATDRLVY